eukprot:TRINITY_DN56668_c0_g1_i1.p1 TRINITY_DN56668_c0_g1~~TRINITY_DN56668_c0_g1_i1.p1  ORF type:complete len:156 (+),score=20.87 TRINITY_DN56668_c0_g1_i1:36-470(+)
MYSRILVEMCRLFIRIVVDWTGLKSLIQLAATFLLKIDSNETAEGSTRSFGMQTPYLSGGAHDRIGDKQGETTKSRSVDVWLQMLSKDCARNEYQLPASRDHCVQVGGSFAADIVESLAELSRIFHETTTRVTSIHLVVSDGIG